MAIVLWTAMHVYLKAGCSCSQIIRPCRFLHGALVLPDCDEGVTVRSESVCMPFYCMEIAHVAAFPVIMHGFWEMRCS